MFRAIAILAVALLMLDVAGRIYLIGEVRPQVEQLRETNAELDALHAAMIDQETAIRAYLATGTRVFLPPYERGIGVIKASAARLSDDVLAGRMTRDFVDVQVARQRWTQDWVRPALDPAQAENIGAAAEGTANAGPLTTFLLTGKVLFDTYRAAHDRLAADVDRSLSKADATESTFLLWTGLLEILLAVLIVTVAFGASHRLRRLIAAPVASLARTVAELRAGNLGARVPLTVGPTELVALSRDFDEMAAELQAQSELAELRQQEARRHADRLALVLGVAREVAGSLSLRYVMESVTAAALKIGSVRARVWLVEPDERTVTLSYDSFAGRKAPAESLQTELGIGGVGRAVKYGRPIGPEPAEEEGLAVLAVPMVIGGRVVGVLECVGPPPSEDAADILHILEALAGHAAGSVESARLHEYTRELAVTDSLTQLPNRRAFDEDIDTEVRRAMRYGRPLSVIYLDLDHFKDLNDRYGHEYGDTALQQTAAALRAGLRSTDRCYRLGGEELIVIAPETSVREAAELAERLRQAVERSAGPDSPRVTASFGVAALPVHATDSANLIRVADGAVYLAKSGGRNRVVVADLPSPPLPRPPVSVEREGVTGSAAHGSSAHGSG